MIIFDPASMLCSNEYIAIHVCYDSVQPRHTTTTVGTQGFP